VLGLVGEDRADDRPEHPGLQTRENLEIGCDLQALDPLQQRQHIAL
jgi:hypothetical protein